MHVYLNYNTRARIYNITKYYKYLLKKYLYKINMHTVRETTLLMKKDTILLSYE